MNKFIPLASIAGVVAVLGVVLVFEPRQAAPVREMFVKAAAATASIQPKPLAEKVLALISFAPAPPAQPAVRPAGQPTQIIRVPAIRDDKNYGWIQLPHGAEVDLVETRRDGMLIRYDETFFIVPRSAVDDGTVVLRKRRGGFSS